MAERYELSGGIQSFFLCHCTRCQKDTGSDHAANLFAKASEITWLYGESDFKTYQHPNSIHVKIFCKKCESKLPMIDESINSVVVPAGSLDSVPNHKELPTHVKS